MDKITKEAIVYVKSNKGFNRILKQIQEKYKSLGRFSGYIVLDDVSEDESKILGAIDYKLYKKSKAKLSITKFIEYFKKGSFKSLSFEDFITEYFREELITNKELKSREEDIRREYFDSIVERYSHLNKGTKWLEEALKQKSYGYTSIIKEYEANKSQLEQRLYNVIKALSELNYIKDKLEPLPMFSSRITKDPHYFDIGSSASRLLIYGICYQLGEKYPKNIEETNEILYSAGIARDELSIFTTIYGIKSIWEEEEHLGWKGFYDSKEPIHLSISNLNKVNKLRVQGEKVYIFENPTVFMEVVKGIHNKQIEKTPALICTSGQLNTASLIVLDKLYKDNIQLYYSGDFDPEGLRIAEKLKKRYGDGLVLWRYSIEDYLRIKGNKAFEGRESKLLKLKTKELVELGKAMDEYKVCGYQELLVESYVDDIVKCNI